MTLKIEETKTLPENITITNKFKRRTTLDKNEQRDLVDYLLKKYPMWGKVRMNSSVEEALNMGDGSYKP